MSLHKLYIQHAIERASPDVGLCNAYKKPKRIQPSVIDAWLSKLAQDEKDIRKGEVPNPLNNYYPCYLGGHWHSGRANDINHLELIKGERNPPFKEVVLPVRTQMAVQRALRAGWIVVGTVVGRAA